MKDIEKGALALDIMGSICEFFNHNDKMNYQDFINIQRNRSKELDKVIRIREKELKIDVDQKGDENGRR